MMELQCLWKEEPKLFLCDDWIMPVEVMSYGNQPAERNTGEKSKLQNLEVGMGG